MRHGTSLALLFTAAAVFGAPQALSPSEARTGPTVVELFTSQSCYSCPPAEAFLGELVQERDDVLGLEFHVDYWDRLVHGGSAWKDIFSSPDSTHRQRVYNMRIRGRSSVYTPQMVIAGSTEAVGSNRREVLAAVADVSGRVSVLEVAVAQSNQGTLEVSVGGTREEAATVWYVQYLREHTTEVLRGENKGKTLTNHNIVREFRPIGEWRGEALRLDLGDVDLPPDHGCAVLVQTLDQDTGVPGPILGAAVCPATVSS